jgi:anti-anti-sigma regulatory factor
MRIGFASQNPTSHYWLLVGYGARERATELGIDIITTVILDITGVLLVDTQVADALLQASRAVRLLGAQVMLIGIRPEVAQTLVGLGADLSGIVTHSTLQSGIAYAMRQRNGSRPT